MNAEDVLFVLNELNPVDPTNLEFGIAVAGRTEIAGTGRAIGRIITLDTPSFWPFEPGEIIVLDKDTGREPFGEGRKPAKWDVEFRYCDTLDEAMAVRTAVLADEPS
jgi:hypothetical protein